VPSKARKGNWLEQLRSKRARVGAPKPSLSQAAGNGGLPNEIFCKLMRDALNNVMLLSVAVMLAFKLGLMYGNPGS
jgi:hypothetical protein